MMMMMNCAVVLYFTVSAAVFLVLRQTRLIEPTQWLLISILSERSLQQLITAS